MGSVSMRWLRRADLGSEEVALRRGLKFVFAAQFWTVPQNPSGNVYVTEATKFVEAQRRQRAAATTVVRACKTDDSAPNALRCRRQRVRIAFLLSGEIGALALCSYIRRAVTEPDPNDHEIDHHLP